MFPLHISNSMQPHSFINRFPTTNLTTPSYQLVHLKPPTVKTWGTRPLPPRECTVPLVAICPVIRQARSSRSLSECPPRWGIPPFRRHSYRTIHVPISGFIRLAPPPQTPHPLQSVYFLRVSTLRPLPSPNQLGSVAESPTHFNGQ